MSNVRLGLDVDGVLADFNTSCIDLVKSELGVDLPAASDTYPDTWYYMRAAGMTKEQETTLWGLIGQSRSFWYKLNHYQGVVKFLYSVTNEIGHENMWFITARLGETAQKQTEMWLRQYGARSPRVIVSYDKSKWANDLNLTHYIDDRNENCLDILNNAPNTKGYMLAQPWNIKQEGIPRLNNLGEFLDILKEANA